MGKRVVSIGVLLTLIWGKAAAQLGLPPQASGISDVKNIRVLPQNFYTRHLPFTCKKEDQLQKHTGLNLFIRLGSKDYVDYLERKPGAGLMRQW